MRLLQEEEEEEEEEGEVPKVLKAGIQRQDEEFQELERVQEGQEPQIWWVSYGLYGPYATRFHLHK